MILKRDGLAGKVVGVGRSLKNLELAVKLGAIDRYEREAEKAIPESDLIILATPVESYKSHLEKWGHLLSPGTIVSDVGSVKGHLVEQAESLVPPDVYFVGAHPIAGKEKSGVEAATPGLFQGSLCILTSTIHTNVGAKTRVERLWESIGSTVMSLDPFAHDWILGGVSHLPHVVAFALMNTLADLQQKTKSGEELVRYSGGGLKDTTRIAASSPEMWRDIFLWNKENLLIMIESMEKQLHHFKSLIKDNDKSGLEHEIDRARKSRESLQ